LTLKNVKEANYKDTVESLKYLIGELYGQHDYLLDSDKLRDYEKDDFKEIMVGEAHLIKYKNSLKKLSNYLYQHHQEQVIVLVDEYDSPIIAGYRNGYYREIITFMRGFLGGVFKTNPYLYKGVVTGILRIAKESLFSEWNNPGVYTVLDYQFSDSFGFTEAETKKMLKHFNLQDDFELMKEWYDGYNIGNSTHLYNPWSVSGYIDTPQQGFRPYWVNTSSDDLLKERVVERDAEETRSDIETLLLGKTILKPIYENIVFADFDSNRELLWTLLVFAGYLIPVDKTNKRIRELRIPNYEITTLFEQFILDWLHSGLHIPSTLLLQMVQALTQNQIPQFEKYFKKIMGDTFSYFDVNKEAEKVWQAYVLGLLAISSDDYIIKSNRESGAGRYDILMLPRVDKSKYGVVIEVKAMDKEATQNQIDTQLEDALKQISKNQYYTELIEHQIEKRIELAVVFAGKELYIKPK
ncbi:MAG: AAA family ATPase, partial [Chitinophagales bacterium]